MSVSGSGSRRRGKLIFDSHDWLQDNHTANPCEGADSLGMPCIVLKEDPGGRQDKAYLTSSKSGKAGILAGGDRKVVF